MIIQFYDGFISMMGLFTSSTVKEESSSPISTANVSGSAGSTAENSTAVVDANSQQLHLLSQSVPTNWGGGGGGGSQPQLHSQHQQQQHHHQQQQHNHHQAAGFNTSVDQVCGVDRGFIKYFSSQINFPCASAVRAKVVFKQEPVECRRARSCSSCVSVVKNKLRH